MRILFFISLLFLLACDPTEQTTNRNYDITLISLDKFSQASNTFFQGDPITLQLTIDNISENPIDIRTGDGCTAQFEILDTNDVSLGTVPRICLAVVPTTTQIQAGDKYRDSVTWDQSINTTNKTRLEIGNYKIIGTVFGLDKSSVQNIIIK